MGNLALLLVFLEEGNILSPDLTTLVVFLIVILLAGLLNRLLFKPVLSVLDEREEKTSGTLAAARNLMAVCDEKLARYEEAIRTAQADNYHMLEARRKLALDERARSIARAKDEAQRLIAVARQEIAAETEEAKKTLDRESRLIAATIASSILRRPLQRTQEEA
ncbi:MAG: ATP synthase F0 subunit B [Acidobacteria bacterium]|nr:ATP synthase F0 subunit B [Acidobacteriota bacterium]